MTWNRRDSDTITRSELWAEMNRRHGEEITLTQHPGMASFVTDVVDAILAKRKPQQLRYSTGHDVFTEAELAAALTRMSYNGPHAPDIVASIKRHREPAWQQGDVIMDAASNVWRRRQDGGWNRTGSGTNYTDEAPLRPIKRMVVES